MTKQIERDIDSAFRSGVAFGAKEKSKGADFYQRYLNEKFNVVNNSFSLLVPVKTIDDVAKTLSQSIEDLRSIISGEQFAEILTSYCSVMEYSKAVEHVTNVVCASGSADFSSLVYSLIPDYDHKLAAANRAIHYPLHTMSSLPHGRDFKIGYVIACSIDLASELGEFSFAKYGDVSHVPQSQQELFKKSKLSIVDITAGLRTIFDRYYKDDYEDFTRFVLHTVNLPVSSFERKEKLLEYRNGYIKIGRTGEVTKVCQLRNKDGFHNGFSAIGNLTEDVPLVIRLTKRGESKFADQLTAVHGFYNDGGISVAYRKVIGSVYVTSGEVGDVEMLPQSSYQLNKLLGVFGSGRFSRRNCVVGVNPKSTSAVTDVSSWFALYRSKMERSFTEGRISIAACAVHVRDEFETNTTEIIDQCPLLSEEVKSSLIDMFKTKLTGDKIVNLFSLTEGGVRMVQIVTENRNTIYVFLKSGEIKLFNRDLEELDLAA